LLGITLAIGTFLLIRSIWRSSGKIHQHSP
jgi:hypothetical protein